jgi:hypothetical protein
VTQLTLILQKRMRYRKFSYLTLRGKLRRRDLFLDRSISIWLKHCSFKSFKITLPNPFDGFETFIPHEYADYYLQFLMSDSFFVGDSNHLNSLNITEHRVNVDNM